MRAVATRTKRASDPPPEAIARDEHRDPEHGHERRVRGDPEAEAEAPQQHPREQREEQDVDDVQERRVGREEARQAGGVVIARRCAVEEDELDQVGAGRGENLVADDQQHEAGREEPAQRRARQAERGRLDVGEAVGEARTGEGEQADEDDLRPGRDEQQVIRAAQQIEQRSAGEAAREEADREARDDAREAALDLLHVEQPPGLAADEDESDLEQHREEHEQRRGHPHAARRRQHRPGRDEQECDGGLRADRDQRQRPAAHRTRDPGRRQRADDGDPDVGEREPLRAVGVEEDRVRDDQEE